MPEIDETAEGKAALFATALAARTAKRRPWASQDRAQIGSSVPEACTRASE